jgi:rRNA biogenesis protein RRP5
VQFYNNVRGIVPKGSARLDQFPVGQTVKVKVLDCEPSTERMRLTFDLEEEVPSESSKKKLMARGDAVADIATGSLIDVKVVASKEDSLEVELVGSGLASRITAYHLSDHPALWNLECAAYSPGDVIEGALVVAKEGKSESLLLSLKPTLIEMAVQDGLPKAATELVPGSHHAGYIRSITSYVSQCRHPCHHRGKSTTESHPVAPTLVDTLIPPHAGTAVSWASCTALSG